MLAHKASHEARVAVDAINGERVAFEPLAIPAVVFTDPELAWCGLTETDAQKQGREFAVARFPWAASGRAITLDRTDGLTKLVLDPKTGRILGVGLVGPGAGELIAEGVLAVEMGATAEDSKLTIHAHPTLSETLMEAAEVFFGQATHVYRPEAERGDERLLLGCGSRSRTPGLSAVCARPPLPDRIRSTWTVSPEARLPRPSSVRTIRRRPDGICPCGSRVRPRPSDSRWCQSCSGRCR